MKSFSKASITNMMMRKDSQQLSEALALALYSDGHQTSTKNLADLFTKTNHDNDLRNLYQYKEENVFLSIDKLPETIMDYYSLSRELHSQELHSVLVMQDNRLVKAEDKAIHILQFSLWNDLASSGITVASEAINHYVINHKDREARQYMILRPYNLLGYRIALPRLFRSDEDLIRLGSALILCKGATPGEKFRGTFFELEDGKDAYALGRSILQTVKENQHLREKVLQASVIQNLNYNICACLSSNIYC